MSANISALTASLEKEAGLMAEFLAVLRQEAKVLEEGAADTALTDVTGRKNAAADALYRVASQRNQLLESQGYAADRAGLDAAVDAHPEIAPLCDRLLDLTGQARALNEANGKIIEVFLDHNQRTLETLRRLAGVGDTYDASGKTSPRNKGSSRNIKAG